jgi:hypothetical protein
MLRLCPRPSWRVIFDDQLIKPVVLLYVNVGCEPLAALAVSVKEVGEVTEIASPTPFVCLKPTEEMLPTEAG